MNCELCDRRTIYYGTPTPCPECKVTKSASKAEKPVPYWVTLAKEGGLL